ncbi:MAG TPA: VWA domain-containing protein [bacterium]|jgi:Ca-activated chloride channel family protein|nr:VWA domain-containing protein [bacterium]HPM46419.1 VWA domain-containing protein [bacterium]HRQ69155.1 VWA domain-containing protein [bacterium]
MMLLDPLWLLLIIPALIITAFQLRIKGSGSSIFYNNFKAGRKKASGIYFLPNIIDLLAVIMAVLALARPVSLEKTVTPPVEGKDIMVVLDVSGSMEALDFQPKNRIEAAKSVIESFVKGRTSDRLGLVFFAKDSFLQVPLTTDYDIFIELLSMLKTGVIEDGTAIGNGLGLAVSRLENSSAKSRIVILLTDGDNNAGNVSPANAAQYASAKGVKIYSILIGTDAEVPFPAGKDFFGRDTFQKVQMKTNPDLLKQISNVSGGKFYQSISTDELKKAFRDIDELEKSPVPARKLKIYNEYAPLFIMLAVIFILLARLIAMKFRIYPEVER